MTRKIACRTTALVISVLVGIGLWVSPTPAKEYLVTGKTMGTYYRVKFIPAAAVSKALWTKKINIRLKQVNARLSMFQKTSEISRFNTTPVHTPFRLSTDFYHVLVQCRALHHLTGGAWDGTVKPLVDLWGFGTRKKTDALPDIKAIHDALDRTGFDKLILEDRVLTKTAPGITLDLGSIAKGYGVDEIARLFRSSGIKNYLVEIGGELAGAGKNKRGKPWTIGISTPEKAAVNPGIYKVIALNDMAIATSGNYRNFFEVRGKTYSHIIQPKTGYPVDNRVVSASVIADNCTLADGLATALMVMDTDQALDLVNRMDNTECLIVKKENKTLVPIRSKGFSAFEPKPEL